MFGSIITDIISVEIDMRRSEALKRQRQVEKTANHF